MKLKFFKEKYYFSIIRILSDDEGKGIICVFNSIKEIFTTDLSVLIQILNIFSEKFAISSEFSKKLLSLQISEDILIKIDNIQSAIISLLINKKVFILDRNYQFFSILIGLINLLPINFHKFLDFTIDSTSLTENINIMTFSYSKDLINQLNDLNKDKNTIIDIQNKVCFGIYSSPLFTEVMKELKKNNIGNVSELLTKLDTICFDKTKIGLKYSDISKKYKITKSDFKLIELIRLNLLNIPQKENLFEELIK